MKTLSKLNHTILIITLSISVTSWAQSTDLSASGILKGYAHDSEGRLVSNTDPKKTRIYLGIDKSGSMRKYANITSDAARSLVSGLSERACSDWEVVVYEIGSYNGQSSYASTTYPEIIHSSTQNGLSKIDNGITSRSRLGTGQEAPLNSLLSVIQDHSNSFNEVDFVASITITDTLVLHEPLKGIDVANEVKSIVGKPFKSWSFNVFPGNIDNSCSADTYGTENKRFLEDKNEFLHSCMLPQLNGRISSSALRDYLSGRGRILNIDRSISNYCETKMLQHFGGKLENYFGSNSSEQTYKELINFTKETDGVSAPLCKSDFSNSFSAITSSILEELGCRMLYLM